VTTSSPPPAGCSVWHRRLLRCGAGFLHGAASMAAVRRVPSRWTTLEVLRDAACPGDSFLGGRRAASSATPSAGYDDSHEASVVVVVVVVADGGG
jgi:hypothetical protein